MGNCSQNNVIDTFKGTALPSYDNKSCFVLGLAAKLKEKSKHLKGGVSNRSIVTTFQTIASIKSCCQVIL